MRFCTVCEGDRHRADPLMFSVFLLHSEVLNRSELLKKKLR